MSISARIKQILAARNLSDKDLATMLKVTPSRISQKFNNDIWDSLAELKKIAKHTDVDLDWIITGIIKGNKNEYYKHVVGKTLEYPKFNDVQPTVVEEKSIDLAGKGLRILNVVVDKQGNELIPFVPVKAQAGYTRGFGDEKFIGTLQSFSIPNLRSGTYRMFEVNGDSMLQITGGGLHDGDIVIAQYLENFYDVRDNRVYVVVSKEGIVIKRLINRLRNENPVIVCKSDNKGGAYPDFLLRPEDLFEIWELKAYISKQLSFNTDLWQMLSDMQAQQAVLAEKLANLEKKAS
ncbi:MAG: XRE family transcriptional regulator [bacterium]